MCTLHQKDFQRFGLAQGAFVSQFQPEKLSCSKRLERSQEWSVVCCTTDRPGDTGHIGYLLLILVSSSVKEYLWNLPYKLPRAMAQLLLLFICQQIFGKCLQGSRHCFRCRAHGGDQNKVPAFTGLLVTTVGKRKRKSMNTKIFKSSVSFSYCHFYRLLHFSFDLIGRECEHLLGHWF